jgi:ketosteroid isomerase-like protein
MAGGSESNVDLVRGLYAAWQAQDFDTALAGIDADIEWKEPPDAPDSRSWRGPDGVVDSTENWTAPFEDYEFEIAESAEIGDQVLITLLQRGRARGSSVSVEEHIWHLWTLRGGKAVRMAMFTSREEALAAAGETAS